MKDDPRHVIGLNLARGPDGDGPPITIDGVPFYGVGDIKVDAKPSSVMTVTVTFHAKHITGVAAPAAPVSYWPAAIEED